jgi:hypothetical protein
MSRCPRCDTAIEPEIDVCPHCEADLCPACGALADPQATACAACGEEWVLSCPRCDGEVTPADQICPHCGFVFDSGSVQAEEKEAKAEPEPEPYDGPVCPECGTRVDTHYVRDVALPWRRIARAAAVAISNWSLPVPAVRWSSSPEPKCAPIAAPSLPGSAPSVAIRSSPPPKTAPTAGVPSSIRSG